MLFIKRILSKFWPAKSKEECVREAKAIREQQSERQIDKTLKDTFPASDPPAWY